MRSRIKLVAALATVLAVVAPAVAHAGATIVQKDEIAWVDGNRSAEAVCTVTAVPVAGGPVILAWEAVAVDGARTVAGCGVVQNGRTVAYASSVGVTSTQGTAVAYVAPGGFRACATLFVVFNDATAKNEDHCP